MNYGYNNNYYKGPHNNARNYSNNSQYNQKRQNINNRFNYNDNISIPNTLKIEEALSKSSYPKYIKSFMKDFLIKNYSANNEAKVYLTLVNNENLFVIEYSLPIDLNGKIYKVNVLVYFPALYPNYEPEFYLSKNGRIGISKVYEKKINSKDLKIKIDSFIPFNPIENNVEEIINKLKIEFNKDFPIFRLDNDLNIPEPFGKCILDRQNSYEILIENENQKSYNFSYNKNFQLYEDNNFNNNKNNQKNNYYINNKGDFDDKSLIDFMRNQVKDTLRAKYMDFNEKYNLRKNYNELKTLNNSVQKKIEKNKSNPDGNQLEKEMGKLKKIKNKLNLIEKQLIQENKRTKNKSKSVLDKCDEYIKIKNERYLELTVMKKTIEDYLVYLRKGYEKKIVSFQDMIDKTRILSREIFNIDYLRKQIKSNC